jgi:hypothetical protein
MRQEWWTQEGKELHFIVQCNTCMKDVERANQYLSYSVLRKTVQWSRKLVVYLINLTLLNTSL